VSALADLVSAISPEAYRYIFGGNEIFQPFRIPPFLVTLIFRSSVVSSHLSLLSSPHSSSFAFAFCNAADADE